MIDPASALLAFGVAIAALVIVAHLVTRKDSRP
jgi:preprotein translocase subunit Sec61beta